jgi:pyruvate dehydrogenase E1 component alpha subunit
VAGLDSDTARELLGTMWRIRLFEERVVALKRSLIVHGLIHVSIGGEGVAAAVCGQLRDDDAVYSGHRAHGHAIAKGAPLDRVMAELMGRADGLCKGLGGSMHLVDREHGFLGATGVVGGNIPLALGNAMAARLNGSDQVTVVFFGDGAVQAGHFHESVNLAALWELPVILVCENNGFAEFTPRSAPRTGSSAVRLTAAMSPRSGRRSPSSSRSPAAAADRCCSSASRTVAAATTRVTRSSTATRSRRRRGASSTRWRG